MAKTEVELNWHPSEGDPWVRTHAIEVEVDKYVLPFDPDNDQDRERFQKMEARGDLNIYALPRKSLAKLCPAYSDGAGKLLDAQRAGLELLHSLEKDWQACEFQASQFVKERDSTLEGPEAFDALAEKARLARVAAEAAEGRFKAQERKVDRLELDRQEAIATFNRKRFAALEAQADKLMARINAGLDYDLVPEFVSTLARMKECHIPNFVPQIQHNSLGLPQPESIGLQTFKFKPQIAKVASGYKFIVEKAHGNGTGRAV